MESHLLSELWGISIGFNGGSADEATFKCLLGVVSVLRTPCLDNTQA